MVSINHELARQIAELVDTAFEGLEHVHRQNMEGKFEQTIPLFTDVIEAFTEIEKILALNGLLDNPGDALTSSTQSLKDAFDWMTKAYEKRDNVRPLEIMQLTLLPRYKKWQEGLRERLRS
jgi:hypothetical protein